MGSLRTIFRLRSKWIQAGSVNTSNSDFLDFSRQLQKGAEHTYGNYIGYINDTAVPNSTYTKDGLREARATNTAIRYIESSWMEQRQFTDNASNALRRSYPQLYQQIQEELKQLRPSSQPITSGYIPVTDVATTQFTCGNFTVRFDENSGAIDGLVYSEEKIKSLTLADKTHKLAWVQYQTFTEANFEHWGKEYLKHGCSVNFCKFGMEHAKAESKKWQPRLIKLYAKSQKVIRENSCNFLAQLEWQEQEPVRKYGAPAELWLEVNIVSPQSISFKLSTFNKEASRLPEGLWITFAPLIEKDPTQWVMDKLGSWINPFNVHPKGNNHLHGVWTGVKYPCLITSPSSLSSSNTCLQDLFIRTLDAGVVSPGGSVPTGLLNYTATTGSLSTNSSGGWHFSLMNNIWNTNYPFWLPFNGAENATFRFQMALESPASKN